MTERLYYENAYLWEFDGTVKRTREGKKPGTREIALDRSAFYPTSGGSPLTPGEWFSTAARRK